MLVLGIESSCDETGLALYCSKHGLLAHHVYSQTNIHEQFGGVVPELASRDHIRKTLPLLSQTLADAKLTLKEIDAIAYTAGPGLIGALLVGASIAKSLSYALKIPALGIHHMEGHLLAPMLSDSKPSFPFIALLVSGGHTLLIKVTALGQYTLLGESIDDAAGEAFDKTAKLLGLPYPGGALLAKLAEQGTQGKFSFSRPMTDRPGLNFSFSGLKTQVMLAWQQSDQTEQTKADIAKAFEEAVIDTLIIKCQRALKLTQINRLVIAGGVSANHNLREKLLQLSKKEGFEIYYPPLAYCTDNGAMIAYAGCQRLLAGQQDQDFTILAKPRWPMANN